MWKRKLEVEAVKFLWKRRHSEERSGSIFHETLGRDVEAKAGSGSKLGSD